MIYRIGNRLAMTQTTQAAFQVMCMFGIIIASLNGSFYYNPYIDILYFPSTFFLWIIIISTASGMWNDASDHWPTSFVKKKRRLFYICDSKENLYCEFLEREYPELVSHIYSIGYNHNYISNSHVLKTVIDELEIPSDETESVGKFIKYVRANEDKIALYVL